MLVRMFVYALFGEFDQLSYKIVNKNFTFQKFI